MPRRWIIANPEPVDYDKLSRCTDLSLVNIVHKRAKRYMRLPASLSCEFVVIPLFDQSLKTALNIELFIEPYKNRFIHQILSEMRDKKKYPTIRSPVDTCTQV